MKINPRRPLDDDEPDGYLESDRDWVDNNFDAVIEFLENHGHTGLNWRPIEEVGDEIRPLFLFSPSPDYGNVKGGMVWVTGGRRAETGGFRGDQRFDPPTMFAEIEGPMD